MYIQNLVPINFGPRCGLRDGAQTWICLLPSVAEIPGEKREPLVTQCDVWIHSVQLKSWTGQSKRGANNLWPPCQDSDSLVFVTAVCQPLKKA